MQNSASGDAARSLDIVALAAAALHFAFSIQHLAFQ
jgi:hypothetical protein